MFLSTTDPACVVVAKLTFKIKKFNFKEELMQRPCIETCTCAWSHHTLGPQNGAQTP